MPLPSKPKFVRIDFLRRFVICAGLALGLAAWVAAALAPIEKRELDSRNAAPYGGFAYTVALPPNRHLLFQLDSDGAGRNDPSRLLVFEDGQPLGPAHAQHVDIARLGAGRFSHWGNDLWFSAGDSSDPRTNGKRYTAEAKLSVRPFWYWMAAAAAIGSLLTLLIPAARRFRSGHAGLLGHTLQRSLIELSSPRNSGGPLTLSLVGLFGVLVCCGAVLYGWHYGNTTTTGLEVARFLPVSDAFGYHRCATSITAAGRFVEADLDSWCSRRALYPAMLASIFSLTAWSSQLALIFQGALAGLAIAAIAMVVAAYSGLLAAAAVAALLFVYAWEFVLGLFMTELMGFTLGLCGLSFLLAFCGTRTPWYLLAGSILLATALIARAGALLALPAIAVWALVAFRASSRAERVIYVMLAVLGVATGVGLQFLLASLFGSDAGNTGGNFAVSLYGLSTGSRDWSQAYRDHAALFANSEAEGFRKIYAISWSNIQSQPAIFIGALVRAGSNYAQHLFAFGILRGYQGLLNTLLLVGVLRCLIEWRSPQARLLIALAAAELMSAPLVFDSGGTRVFAATVAVRFLFCALAVQWILQFLLGLLTGIRSPLPATTRVSSPIVLAAAAGGTSLMLALAAATPLIELVVPHHPQIWDALLAYVRC